MGPRFREDDVLGGRAGARGDGRATGEPGLSVKMGPRFPRLREDDVGMTFWAGRGMGRDETGGWRPEEEQGRTGTDGDGRGRTGMDEMDEMDEMDGGECDWPRWIRNTEPSH